jgi:ankyrin repeat protein
MSKIGARMWMYAAIIFLLGGVAAIQHLWPKGGDGEARLPAERGSASEDEDALSALAGAVGMDEQMLRASLEGTLFIPEDVLLEQARRHIEQGGSPNDVVDPTTRRTWMHLAAMMGHRRVVVYLLDHGGNVNGRRETVSMNGGETPLHYASTPDVVAALIEHGADLEARDDSMGRTPFLTACYMHYPDVAKKLVEAGADRHATSLMFGWNAAAQVGTRLAIQRGDPRLDRHDEGLATLNLLGAMGVDMNAADDDGMTPLHSIAPYSADYVRRLLDLGADPFAVDNTGQRPIDRACPEAAVILRQAMEGK